MYKGTHAGSKELERLAPPPPTTFSDLHTLDVELFKSALFGRTVIHDNFGLT